MCSLENVIIMRQRDVFDTHARKEDLSTGRTRVSLCLISFHCFMSLSVQVLYAKKGDTPPWVFRISFLVYNSL